MIIFEGNSITNSNILDGATVISNDKISAIDYDELKSLLNVVVSKSINEEEKQHAVHAVELCGKKDKNLLKSYIMENISSFVTGTFATVAGGLLQNMIQNLIG